MDISAYFDEEYNSRTKDPAGKTEPFEISITTGKKEPVPAVLFSEPRELTDEIVEAYFHNFEKEKIFIATFLGKGPNYTVGQNAVTTWAFADKDGLHWYIPQWVTMDVPQGLFKGFSKEDPQDNFWYCIEYIELVETSRGKKHHIKIHRKLS